MLLSLLLSLLLPRAAARGRRPLAAGGGGAAGAAAPAPVVVLALRRGGAGAAGGEGQRRPRRGDHQGKGQGAVAAAATAAGGVARAAAAGGVGEGCGIQLQALQQVGAGGVGARRIAVALQTTQPHVIQAVQAWRQPWVAQPAVQLRAGGRRTGRRWWEAVNARTAQFGLQVSKTSKEQLRTHLQVVLEAHSRQPVQQQVVPAASLLHNVRVAKVQALRCPACPRCMCWSANAGSRCTGPRCAAEETCSNTCWGNTSGQHTGCLCPCWHAQEG